MLPNRLARAFGRLNDMITRSRVMAVLAPLRLYSAGPKPDVQPLLDVFAALSASYSQFGEPEQKLLKALNLDPLVDSAWWARLITATTRATIPDELASGLLEMYARLEFVAGGFSALAGLLDASEAVTEAEANGLVLTLPGMDGEPPSLARVSSTMEAMNQLWAVAEDLTGQRGTLQLLATDPGPVMSLYFDGPSDALLELRALLESVWEQAGHLPGVGAEQHAALVPEMLPVMERIGRGGRAEAQRIRSTVERGVRHLLEARCFLRGMPRPPEPSSQDHRLPGPPPQELQPLTTGLAGGSVAPEPAERPAAQPVAAPAEALGHLAQVIAEERRQLQQSDPPRRLWHSSSMS